MSGQANHLVMSREDFMDYLARARNGEEPNHLFMEFYVNSDSEHVEGDPS